MIELKGLFGGKDEGGVEWVAPLSLFPSMFQKCYRFGELTTRFERRPGIIDECEVRSANGTFDLLNFPKSPLEYLFVQFSLVFLDGRTVLQ